MSRISIVTATSITRCSNTEYRQQTAIWYLCGGALVSGLFGPTLPSGWALVATPDFDGDCKPDYVLYGLAPAKLRFGTWTTTCLSAASLV